MLKESKKFKRKKKPEMKKFLKNFQVSKELILTIQSFIKDIHNDKNNYQAQTETNINKKIELLNK